MKRTRVEADERISLVALIHSRWRDVPVTIALIAINVAVYTIMAVSSGDAIHPASRISLDWGANFGPATKDGEWWRLLTAVFVHLGVIHVAVNLWALWDVGRLVERLLGWWRYAILFVGSGVFGNLISLALQDHQRVSSGASGAIFGLYGALMAFLWRRRKCIVLSEYRWIFGFAVAFSVLMLVMGMVIPSIDNAAHGGGLLAGVVLGKLLGHSAVGPVESSAPTLISAAGLLSAVVVVAIFFGLSSPPYRYSEERNARTAINKFVVEDQAISTRWNALLASDSGEPFDHFAEALNREVAEPYQRSFEALSKADTSSNLPSRAVLLQMQSYAQRRSAEAIQDMKAFQSASDSALGQK
jgi:rhomboid protease GluP